MSNDEHSSAYTNHAEKGVTRTRQRLDTIPQTVRLTGSLLCGYAPGTTFWDHVVPGNTRDFQSHSFQDVYLGDVPDKFAARIDRLLIDWLSDRISGGDASAQMEHIIHDLKALRSDASSSVDADDVDLLPALVDSLTRLRDTILPDADRKHQFVDTISELRQARAAVDSRSAGQHPGRG